MEQFSIKICKRRRVRNGRVTTSKVWYGRKRANSGKAWTYVKLYRDRRASEIAWQDFRTRAERMDAGIISLESERLKLPLKEIIDAYHTDLRRQGRDSEHVKISKWMLDRAALLGNWSNWPDVNIANVHKLIDDMQEAGATASYRNKVIMRLKAFVRWALPEGWANPLSKLRRVSERGAVRNRARRAASHAELSAFVLRTGLPANRQKAYALAAYNGLRRNEAARLDWTHIDADSRTMRVPWKMGDGFDTIPIHPFVFGILLPDGMPTPEHGRILTAVPDIKTLLKDLAKAGITFKDKEGNRLDYHALRHTFATALSRYGASSATRKKLMRHQHETVTDRYTHADIQEMATALARIPWPSLKQSGPQRDYQQQAKPTPSGMVSTVTSTSNLQNWTENMASATLSLARPDTQVGEGDSSPDRQKTPEHPKGTQKRTTRRAMRMSKRRMGLLRAFIRAGQRREAEL